MTNSTGKFDLVELLGSGPNGDTSLAVDTVLGRVVVLKQYTQVNNVPLEAIFQTNVNALYSMTSPTFALVYSASPVGSPAAFVAREHVNGLTLDRMVGKLGVSEKYYLAALVAEIADLLRDFAKSKITHGNLKFSNLMVNQTGGVKVLDPAVLDIPKPDSDVRALGVLAYYLWVELDSAVVDQPFSALVSSLSESFDPKQCLLDDPLVDTIAQCLAFNGKNSVSVFDDCIRRIDLWLVGTGRTRSEVIADGAQSLNYLFLTSGSIESTDAGLAADSDAEPDNLLDYDYSLDGDFSPEVPEWDPMQSATLSSPPPERVVDVDAELDLQLPQPDNRPSLFYAPDAALAGHSVEATPQRQSIDISQLTRIAAALLLLVLGMWAVWPDDGTDDANEQVQQQVKEEAPKVDPALLLETARKFSSGSVDEALIAARAAVEALPEHWEAQFLFGRSLMRDGAWKEAQDSLVRSQQLLPERVEPHRGLVELLLHQKLNRPAAQAARRALAFHGTDARLYLLLARAEMGDRRLSEAQEALEMAVQLTPNIKHAWHLLGQVHAWQGRHREAVTAFKTALKFEPEIADSYVGLGRSLLALGEGGDAVTTLANGLVYAPKAFELRYALGRVLMIESKLQSAVPHLESFVDSVPNHWKGVFTLGLTYLRLGRLQAAQKAFATARRLRPKNAIIEFNSAMVLVRLGEVRKAAEALSTAVELRYSLWEAHCERARILHRLGRYTDAEAGYAEAVKLNPKLVVAKAVLASGIQTGMGYMFQGLPCSSVRYLDIRD